ncbi:hypothetical protein HOK51_02650 [Candidatus Woesearchaeota archaeon]|jgi:hypothetical protein|nr:hypothetical protein [Candidatus Woesearchaeota archaeon]MBT6518718.1 hypothetical protein [Candidatus Woesearchaeota archaeon]MBT7367889.1 hypothetical protein [Candidatus Woesearchaeota archaeon]
MDKLSLKTKFGKLICSENESKKTLNIILNALKKAEKSNYSIFKIKPADYTVELVYSNKEYDTKTGLTKTKTHRGGYVKKNKIIIISPNIKKLLFEPNSFFFHELNHIFYNTLIGSYNPVWFSEGMATYLMKTYKLPLKQWKQHFKKMKNPEQFLHYRYIKKKYYKNRQNFYALSYILYRYIHLNYGEKKVLLFLKKFANNPNQKNFNLHFEKIFKSPIKTILKQAIN